MSGNPAARSEVFDLIDAERERQDAKWGWMGEPGTTLPGTDLHKKNTVLGEEVGEVANAILEHDLDNLRAELVQVAAVCVAWVEADLTRENVHTWQTIPVGWDVPGSGVVLDKEYGGNGRLYITFRRTAPFYERWTAGYSPDDRVPIALSSRGLVYP